MTTVPRAIRVWHPDENTRSPLLAGQGVDTVRNQSRRDDQTGEDMTRTDLIALAELLAAGTITDSESQRLADFARQIAQAQPVGYLLKTGHGNRFAETIPENPIELTLAGKPAWSAIYTLPLED